MGLQRLRSEFTALVSRIEILTKGADGFLGEEITLSQKLALRSQDATSALNELPVPDPELRSSD